MKIPVFETRSGEEPEVEARDADRAPRARRKPGRERTPERERKPEVRERAPELREPAPKPKRDAPGRRPEPALDEEGWNGPVPGFLGVSAGA
jgi:hypothetical protein